VVITDGILVDMKFGTGAVKITPAHDPNDFACGMRYEPVHCCCLNARSCGDAPLLAACPACSNKLPQINVFDDTGNINANGGPFAGQKRFHAREEVIKQLQALGLYRNKEPNKVSTPRCSRRPYAAGSGPSPELLRRWPSACAPARTTLSSPSSARSGGFAARRSPSGPSR
jgi:valyl-tRNA synthetase